MDQHQFVQDCYLEYAAEGLEPGNPLDGEWHEAHYPAPKCLGGAEVIWLLKEHHAIQGVLQSEEYQHPCIWGWEKAHLEGHILDMWGKWMRVKAQPAVENSQRESYEVKRERGKLGSQRQSLEDKRKGGVAAMAKLSLEEKRQRYKSMKDRMSPEKEVERSEKAKESTLRKNPDHYKDMARKARDGESKEVKAARARSIPQEALSRGRAKTNSRKFRCLATGKISTAGPLTLFQKKRGIDPSLRELVSDTKQEVKENNE